MEEKQPKKRCKEFRYIYIIMRYTHSPSLPAFLPLSVIPLATMVAIYLAFLKKVFFLDLMHAKPK